MSRDSRRLAGSLLILVPAVAFGGASLMPLGFFLAVADPAAAEPNALISLVAIGGLSLVAGVLTLGVGLLRLPRAAEGT